MPPARPAPARQPPKAAPPPSGLDTLLRHSPDGLLISGETGRVVFASQVAAEALGFDGPAALMEASLDYLNQRYVIEEPTGPAAPDAPLPGYEVLRGLPEPDRLLRFRDLEHGWDRWVQLRTARSAKHVGEKTTILTMVRDVSAERRREVGALFLDEAAGRLSRSLSTERVLEHAAVVAVPRLADECVLIEQQPGRPALAVAWHIPGDPGEGRAVALKDACAPLIAEVLAIGRAVLLNPAGPGLPGVGSVLVAPVTPEHAGKDEVSTVIVLVMAQDLGRRHHPSDLSLAEQLGRRVGHALANARQLENEQRRRHLSEESEACARHLSQALEARLADVQRELESQLAPLLGAASLLSRGAGNQHQLVEVVKRQCHLLRALATGLREAPPPLDTAEIGLDTVNRLVR